MWLSTGFGGAIGCIIGGVMTEFTHPKWSFYLYSFFGIIISFAACFLTKKSEQDAKVPRPTDSEISTSLEEYEAEQRAIMIKNGEDPQEVKKKSIPKRKGFWYNLKINCIQIGRAIKMREIFQVVIFFVALAILNPKFEEFSYFFLLNVIGISKFMFSIL